MRTLYFFFASLLCLTASAQRISDFNVYDGGNGSTIVRFVLTPGPTCSGYEVMHSTDSVFFKSVHFYDQACGGSGAPEPFEWVHSTPTLNQNNFYKVQLLSPYETSPIRRLYIAEPGRSQMIVWPNPALQNTDAITIRASNAGSVKLIGYMYNRFGTPIGEMEIYTTADVATLNIDGLADGMYILWLTDGSNQYSSKFFVER
jgi:hypothetical protein